MDSRQTSARLGELHAQLTDQVTAHLRREIVEGVLEPGSRLVERDLAARLAVSRVPVREALQRLDAEGFVSRLPRRGMVVSRLTGDDLEHIFEVREALEVQAVRLAARRATPDQLGRLREIVTGSRASLESGDLAAVNAMNEAFHDLVTAAARNPVLTATLEPLQGRLHWLLRQNNDPDLMVNEHEALLAAIADRDVERAAALAAGHIATSRILATEILDRRHEHADTG